MTQTSSPRGGPPVGASVLAASSARLPAHADADPRRTLLLLAGILAALTLARVLALFLNNTDLFTDEAQYWSWSRELAFGYYSKPPLIAWIIAGATQICGDGEACVRLPSPLIHAATSFLIFFIGRRLYSDQVGFWSALAYATIPGVSLSSAIISTDAPLLFAWALALLSFIELVDRPRLAPALLLGLGLGIGLNAKYAMAYFVPCAAIYFLFARQEAVALLRGPYLWIAAAVGAALIVPNVVWNATHGFATLSHTADNAGWSGVPFHPGKAAEFLAAQFGVFGPILFGALLVIAWRTAGSLATLPRSDRLLASFAFPVLLLVTTQALLSHAFANWAATAYVAATVLVTAVMIRDRAWGWLKGSLAVNAVIALAIPIALWQAGNFTLPGVGDPFARTLGNRGLADAVTTAIKASEAAGTPVRSVFANDREITAALLYYAPDLAPRLYQWRDAGRARDHYQLTRPFGADVPGPSMLVSRQADPSAIRRMFTSVTPLGMREIPAGRHTTRRVYLFVVSGPKGAT